MSRSVRKPSLPAVWSEIHKLKKQSEESIGTVRLWVGCCVVTVRVSWRRQTRRLYDNRTWTETKRQTVEWTPGGVRQWARLCSNSCKKKQMTALVSAPHLSQAVFCEWFSGVCLNALESNQMEITASWTNKFSQMSFHDVRHEPSVREGLDLSGFYLLRCRWLRYATWEHTFERMYFSEIKHYQAHDKWSIW